MELHYSNNNYRNNVEHASRIFTKYGGFIYAVLLAKVQNRDQADDIFQDFFLSLVSKPIPASVNNIKSYLYKAITNDIVDASRRVKRYKVNIYKYSLRTTYFINKNSPEKALIGEEQMNKMFELIKEQLPSSRSRAIVFRYRDGQSIKKISEKMCVKSKSVSRYISTGLKEIRRLLAGK